MHNSRALRSIAALGLLGVLSTMSPANAAETAGTDFTNPGQIMESDPALAVSSMNTRMEADAATGNALAVQNLQQWDALSAAQQTSVAQVANDERLVEVIATGVTDPALLHEISPGLEVATEADKAEQYMGLNGDAPPPGSTTTMSAAAQAPVTTMAAPPDTSLVKYYHVTATYTYSYKVFGILITRIKQTFTYQTNARVVTRVYACMTSSTNYSPTRTLSASTTKYKSGDRGYCNTVWTIKYKIGWIPTPFSKSFGQHMVVNGRDVERRYLS